MKHDIFVVKNKRQFLNNNNEMTGSGVFSTLQSVYKTADNLYSSALTKKIIDALPDSDETARPGFKGEKHMILKLENGKNGVANFAGPGTNVLARLRRNDPPRTLTDAISKKHDIDYVLAQNSNTKTEQLEKIRNADKRMVNSLNKIQRTGADHKRNIFLAKNAIRSKMALENTGVLSKEKFAGPLKSIPTNDLQVLRQHDNDLQQQGFGARSAFDSVNRYPGDDLLEKIGKGLKLAGDRGTKRIGTKSLKREQSSRIGVKRLNKSEMKRVKEVCKCEMKGSGMNMKKILKKLKPLVVKYGPTIVKALVKKYTGKGLGLPGGLVIKPQMLYKFIDSNLLPKITKLLHLKKTLNHAMILKEIKSLKSTGPKYLVDISKKILPHLVKNVIGNKTKVKISKTVIKKLSDGIWGEIKSFINSKNSKMFKGSGLKLVGTGKLWSAFKKGFVKVLKPALKVGSVAAMVTGHPLLSTALKIGSELV